ncbi:MAG: hypothetical protein KME38_19175 [Spirirestis rafaelensis WJT71-NPBG6]|jgi:hypothetical protein|nr:hypothetical protein [Spirirestis rafaelensis WJT71-NPBG6]
MGIGNGKRHRFSKRFRAKYCQTLGEFIDEFTGGNPGIEQSLTTMYQQEEVEAASRGMGDAALWEYMGRAIALL